MIADKIRKLRRGAGLTQKEMSDILRCSVATVCGYETGKIHVPFEAAKIYARHFGCPAEYLMSDEMPLMDNPGALRKNPYISKIPVLKNLATVFSGNNVYTEIYHPFVDNPVARKGWLMSKTDEGIEIAIIVETETFREGDHVVVVLEGKATTHGYYYIDEERRVCIKSKPKGNRGIRNIRVGLKADDRIIGFVETIIKKQGT